MDTKILIAIITACAALSGVILSQAITLFISLLDKRHKKHILLRQKYEEMMFHFQDSLAYFPEVGNCKTREQLFSKSHSIPAQKAMGIALLYFPQIAPLIETYILNQIAYYNIIISSFNPDIPANAGGQAQVNCPDKIKKVTQDLFKSKNKIIESLQVNVKKYTKA